MSICIQVEGRASEVWVPDNTPCRGGRNPTGELSNVAKFGINEEIFLESFEDKYHRNWEGPARILDSKGYLIFPFKGNPEESGYYHYKEIDDIIERVFPNRTIVIDDPGLKARVIQVFEELMR